MHIYRLLILMVFIPMLGACVVGASNLKEGIESFRTQDYRRAFIRLMPEAEKGQPEAQYAIGYMYYYGQGVVEDRNKAWFWINMAARLGLAEANEAVKILEKGSVEKQKIFESKQLQRFPVDPGMY